MLTVKSFVLIIIVLIAFCSVDSRILWPKPRLDGRIVGGYHVAIEDLPHQVSLQLYGSHFCGGSIISKNWVITAGHCTYRRDAESLKVRLGSSYHAIGGSVIQVKNIVQHENFSYYNIDYDFSLLELVSNITFDETKQPIKLPNQDEVIPDNTDCIVSGWGNTQSIVESSYKLRATIVPTVNQTKCADAYSQFGGITDRMICAGYTDGGKDACQGDSGGPLSFNGTLVGIVSWGYGCAEPSFPGVYSRVSSVRSWIKQNSGI